MGTSPQNSFGVSDVSAPLKTDVEAKVIQVIRVVFLRGEGIEKDPIREVIAYFDLEGNFLCERDPCEGKP